MVNRILILVRVRGLAGMKKSKISTRFEVDKVIKDSGKLPMGPFTLADLSGLDIAVHTAEHLRDAYGERFYVMSRMKELVEAAPLGQKAGKGFYRRPADVSGLDTIVNRMGLKTLVETCSSSRRAWTNPRRT